MFEFQRNSLTGFSAVKLSPSGMYRHAKQVQLPYKRADVIRAQTNRWKAPIPLRACFKVEVLSVNLSVQTVLLYGGIYHFSPCL